MGQSEGSIWVGGSGSGAYVKVKGTFEADTKVASCAQISRHFCAGFIWLFGADFFFTFWICLGNYASRIKAATAWL